MLTNNEICSLIYSYLIQGGIFVYYDIKYEIEVKEERIGQIADEISDLKNGYVDATYDLATEISLKVHERSTLREEVSELKKELSRYQRKDKEFE